MRLDWKLILDPVNADPVAKRAYISLDDDPHNNMIYTLNGSVVLESGKVRLVDIL